MHDEIRFFVPGPTYVPEDVREAMTQPPVGHRSAAFKEIYERIVQRLPAVFRTSREVVPVTGSATLAMEMAIVSLSTRHVLNVTCGAFSERWHTISQSLGREADQVAVPWGRAVEPDLLRAALERRDYEVVTLVHNETSTGVLNPLAELAAVVRETSDALVVVDTVSSMAGARVETDAWDLDFVLTGSQKALALPSGLALFSASARALERAARVPHRGFYTDVLRYLDNHHKGSTPTTPAIPQFYALDRQLDRLAAEGMEARWQRHLEMRERTEAWVAASEFTYASAPDTTSPTVSCLKPPPGVDAPGLVQHLAVEGFAVGGGYGQWKPETFRIGHMGEVRLSDLERLLETLDRLV